MKQDHIKIDLCKGERGGGGAEAQMRLGEGILKLHHELRQPLVINMNTKMLPGNTNRQLPPKGGRTHKLHPESTS